MSKATKRVLAKRTLTVMQKEQFYLAMAKKYQIQPDSAVIMALKTRRSHFKPGHPYTENECAALAELIMLDHNAPNFHYEHKPTDPNIVDNTEEAVYFDSLDFSRSKINSNGVIILAKVLEHDKHIKKLNLQESGIGPRGARALANSLLTNTTLQILNLHGNKLLSKGAIAFVTAITKGNHDLRFFDVTNNLIPYSEVSKLRIACLKCNETRRRTLDEPHQIEIETDKNSLAEEILNAITHGFGILFAVCALVYLLSQCYNKSPWHLAAALIYGFSMLSVYMASCLFHSFVTLGRTRYLFQKLDHCAIYFLIAGTYTPVLLINCNKFKWMPAVLVFEWVCAFIGICIDAISDRKNLKAAKLTLMLAMGWAAGPLIMIENVHDYVSMDMVYWLLAGGLCYTIGVPFYILGNKIPRYHVLWHLFVLGGTINHFFGICLHTLPIEISS